MKVTPTSFVTIDYLIRSDEDEYFPESRQPEELSFCLGVGLMPGPLEEALVGMAPSDSAAAARTRGEGSSMAWRIADHLMGSSHLPRRRTREVAYTSSRSLLVIY